MTLSCDAVLQLSNMKFCASMRKFSLMKEQIIFQFLQNKGVFSE